MLLSADWQTPPWIWPHIPEFTLLENEKLGFFRWHFTYEAYFKNSFSATKFN